MRTAVRAGRLEIFDISLVHEVSSGARCLSTVSLSLHAPETERRQCRFQRCSTRGGRDTISTACYDFGPADAHVIFSAERTRTGASHVRKANVKFAEI